MYKILFAEDDESLGTLVSEELRLASYDILWCRDGVSCLQSYVLSSFDLCILDIMMPALDGFEVARSIRKQNKEIPIIFLTAKSLQEDRLTGFEIGADDYVIKPFSIKELCYRIEACMRRIRPVKVETEFSFGSSKLDTKNNNYIGPTGLHALTQREAEILKLLCNQKNMLVRREDLLVELWGENDYFKGRSLDVFVARLRKILKDDVSVEIRNTHGIGFTLFEK